jgi:hypothetical protein
MYKGRGWPLTIFSLFIILGVFFSTMPGTGNSSQSYTVILTPVADTYVSEKNPQENFGSQKDLRINGPDTGIRTLITYLKFEIPGTDPIERAVLKLFVTKSGGGGAVTTSSETGWDELVINYNNKLVEDGTEVIAFQGSTPRSYLEIDLTGLEISHGLNTLVIMAFNKDGGNFKSNDEGTDPPVLEIEFGSSTGPVDPSQTPTDTPSPLPSPTPTHTFTPTSLPSPTPTHTFTPTSPPSPTPTHTFTPTSLPSPTPTDTPSPLPSPTPTHTFTPTSLPSPTPTHTFTPTSLPSPTPTDTPSPLPSPTPTHTFTPTPTNPGPAPGYYFPPPGETLEFQDQRLPGEVGLSEEIIQALTGRATRWALWRHGYLVHVEGDFNSRLEVKSLRKTWHALTVGAAIQQGRLSSYDEYISQYVEGLEGNDALATFWHVVTQTSGFDYPGCDDPNDYLPGEIWTYSDYNPYYLNRALAEVYGWPYTRAGYTSLLKEAYFDAIGMSGWSLSINTTDLDGLGDGVRLRLDLEDMGRLGLLALADGTWQGDRLIAPGFVQSMETKQVYGLTAVYDGCNGSFNLNADQFPEAPYGFMTWVNTDGDYYPGADSNWAWGSGNGGFYILWNRTNGIVFAAMGANFSPSSFSYPHIIEANITGPNPLIGE